MQRTFFQRNRIEVAAWLLLLAVGLAYFGSAVYSLLRSRTFLSSMPSVTATVTRTKSRRQEGRRITRVYVSYVVDGTVYRDVYAPHQRYVLEKGDAIIVHYDPARPRRIAAADQTYGSRFLCIPAGLLMMGFSVYQLRGVRKRDEKAMFLSGVGVRVQARITGVTELPGKRESGRLVTVACAWYDSHALLTRTFQSEPFSSASREELVGATVSVLVDPGDYGTYHVETDTLATAKE